MRFVSYAVGDYVSFGATIDGGVVDVGRLLDDADDRPVAARVEQLKKFMWITTCISSAVLEAMNVPYERAMGAIRFSLSRYTPAEEIGQVLARLPSMVIGVRNFSGT